MITGVLYKTYGLTAQKTPYVLLPLFETLWKIRKSFTNVKNAADAMRALLFRYMVPLYVVNHTIIPISLERLPRLEKWLMSTGEFREEARRISLVSTYLGTLSKDMRNLYLESIETITCFFVYKSQELLSIHTSDCNSCCKQVMKDKEIREDIILRTRPAILYHLNMIGAEFMNVGLREEFFKATNKIVQIPGCMRVKNGTECKAVLENNDIICK